MSDIRRISGSSPLSPTQGTNPSATSSSFGDFTISFHEHFEFPKKKLTIKEEYNAAVAPAENPFYPILLKLFVEILECRIDIVPTQPTDGGGYAVEAFFRPPEGIVGRGAIHLPLPIKALTKKVIKAPSGTLTDKLPPSFVQFIEGYVEQIIENFTNEQLLRLIIVAAHEFGHYQSFVRGNHDENLKRGLYLFQKKYLKTSQADEYTWLVFREECQAWHYAEVFLRKTKFEFWDSYEEVKSNSLQTYFETLNLNNASLATYYKMSFLGEDFKKNSLSHFFNKEQLSTQSS